MRPMRPGRQGWAPAPGVRGWCLLPQVSPRSSGASLRKTCMVGTSCTSTCRPRLVWAMTKKVEGLKTVMLAADKGKGSQ